MVQLSHPYMTTGKTTALTTQTFVGKVMSLILICKYCMILCNVVEHPQIGDLWVPAVNPPGILRDDYTCMCVASVLPNSLQRSGLKPSKPLCPWNSPGKNTGVDCPLAGDLPDSRIKSEFCMSPALGGWFFTTSTTWKTHDCTYLQPKFSSQFSYQKSERDFPGRLVAKNLPCGAGDVGLIPGQRTMTLHAENQLSPHATNTEP